MTTMDNAVPDWADTIGDTRLIEFVKARLKEDEAAAQAATEMFAAVWTLDLNPPRQHVVADAVPVASGAISALGHIARYDPARALREIEIKHEHLRQYRMAVAACQMAGADEAKSLTSYRAAAWGAVLTDSRAWSDHPDFDDRWR